jgi:hypothetical protein
MLPAFSKEVQRTVSGSHGRDSRVNSCGFYFYPRAAGGPHGRLCLGASDLACFSRTAFIKVPPPPCWNANKITHSASEVDTARRHCCCLHRVVFFSSLAARAYPGPSQPLTILVNTEPDRMCKTSPWTPSTQSSHSPAFIFGGKITSPHKLTTMATWIDNRTPGTILIL